MPFKKEPKKNNERFIPLEYGSTELPQFSPEERAVREVPIDAEEFFKRIQNERSSGRTEFAEALAGLKGSVVLRWIDDVVAQFVAWELKKHLIDPALAMHARSAVERREWSGVTPRSGESFALHELAAKANRLKHELVAEWIRSKSPDTGLTKTAEAEYLLLAPAMAALDILYLRILTDKSPIDSAERTRRGMTDECSVVREKGDKVAEVKMHVAYKEEYKAIQEAYANLVSLLKKERAKDKAAKDPKSLLSRKIRYYEAVLKAFTTSKKSDWLKADELFPQQIQSGADMMHIHPMERGYMKDRHIREPQIGLRSPDSEAARTQQFSAETKARMLAMMNDPAFADIGTMQGSKELVEKSNATARHSLGAGTEMDLKVAGQILPNELDTRVRGGVDTSLDVSTIIERQPVINAGFVKVFGQEAFSKHYEPRLDPEYLLGDSVASHEYGHAIGLNATTEKRLGNDLVGPYIEEWKATVGGLMFNTWLPFLRDPKSVSLDQLKTAVMYQLGSAVRYSKNRDQDSAAGYYRQSIMLMKVAEETGIVQKDASGGESPWKIHLDEANIRAFFEALQKQYHDVLEIYEKGERRDLERFLGGHLQPTEFVTYMARAVEEPGKPLPPPGASVKLPK